MDVQDLIGHDGAGARQDLGGQRHGQHVDVAGVDHVGTAKRSAGSRGPPDPDHQAREPADVAAVPRRAQFDVAEFRPGRQPHPIPSKHETDHGTSLPQEGIGALEDRALVGVVAEKRDREGALRHDLASLNAPA